MDIMCLTLSSGLQLFIIFEWKGMVNVGCVFTVRKKNFYKEYVEEM